ncbi:hypothetical protein EDF63_3442 [Curtobacterium sp. JUb34]|uniref:hypothetical protein n=1 Tax=Curtobacterium sp. JUb34 TaxID=2485109 RepID=UPI000FC2478C|nr:hypothetical protein [Curtobacterium sp. JUb34]ROR28851.1 hypothetical protein EDF63_3442 [Curtobacterium sp. JUb34]
MQIDAAPLHGLPMDDAQPRWMKSSWRRLPFALRYAIDVGEDHRRGCLGIGAVTEVATLAAALSLPTSTIGPVSLGGSTEIEALLGTGLVNAVYDVDGSPWGNRVGTVPLAPLEAVVSARSLDAGIARADRLAGYASRSVLMPDGAAVSDQDLAMADLYGIGVRQGSSAAESVLLCPPGELQVDRVTAEWWAFCEGLYAEHLTVAGFVRAQRSSLNQLWTSAGGLSPGR